jgi:hypothetical protein
LVLDEVLIRTVSARFAERFSTKNHLTRGLIRFFTLTFAARQPSRCEPRQRALITLRRTPQGGGVFGKS